MEECIVSALDLVVFATHEYAKVLEKTTALLQSIPKEEGKKLMETSEAIAKKMEELGDAEKRLYSAQHLGK